MTNKEIIQISEEGLDRVLALDTAKIYADAFRDPKFWDENTICPTTNVFYGEDTAVGEPCPCCKEALQEAYPVEATADKIQAEVLKLGAIAFLGYIDNEVAGASWGFITNPAKLAVSKWATEPMQQQVADYLQQEVGDEFFYGSETFSVVRNQGLATDFQLARIGAVSQLDLPVVGRTLKDKTMARIYENLGYKELDIQDTENPERALFAFYPEGEINEE